MMTRKNFTIIFLATVFIFICVILYPVFSKEAKDITYSDFQLAIGPFLIAIGVLVSYRAARKKQVA